MDEISDNRGRISIDSSDFIGDTIFLILGYSLSNLPLKE